LKPSNRIKISFDTTVREENPLKQGLKRHRDRNTLVDGAVREENPLKQGLKLLK